jgi:hypothetical protein
MFNLNIVAIAPCGRSFAITFIVDGVRRTIVTLPTTGVWVAQ